MVVRCSYVLTACWNVTPSTAVATCSAVVAVFANLSAILPKIASLTPVNLAFSASKISFLILFKN